MATVEVTQADEEAARRAVAEVEVARTGVVRPANGSRPYSYVTFAGARIEFQQLDSEITYHNGSPVYDAATSKAAEQADRINETLMELAYAAARNARLTSSRFKDAEIAQARAEAFEEAARVAEAEMATCNLYVERKLGGEAGIEKNTARYQTARTIATAIRALKEKTDGK